MPPSGRLPVYHPATCALPANGRVAVVGESRYQSVLRTAAHGIPADASAAGILPATAVLVPEPDNQHDANAVRVDLAVDGQQRTVGYLSRPTARRYQPGLLALLAAGVLGSCPADIVGGGLGSKYGVVLRLGPPESLPRSVSGDPLTIPIPIQRSSSPREPARRQTPARPAQPAGGTPVRPSRRKQLWIGAAVVGALMLIAAISTPRDSTPTAAPTVTTAPVSAGEAVVPLSPAPATQLPADSVQPPAATQKPVTPKPAPAPRADPAPAPTCNSNYSGCVPIARDVDCAGGSGDGPAYVRGPVRVIGSDVYKLDADNDGVACE